MPSNRSRRPFSPRGASRGSIQIWSGYLARTAPGWALLSRGPANIPSTQGYEHFEGIAETDTWFGPLFTNIRLTRTNAPVEFNVRYPLFQVQPLLAAMLRRSLLRRSRAEGPERRRLAAASRRLCARIPTRRDRSAITRSIRANAYAVRHAIRERVLIATLTMTRPAPGTALVPICSPSATQPSKAAHTV